MHHIETYSRAAFLKDHPPILTRMEITSTGTEFSLVAGTVMGSTTVTASNTTTVGAWQPATDGKTSDLVGVLAGDVTVPATGNAYADVYTHAAVIAAELTWADGVSAADQKVALSELRKLGIFA